MSLACVELTPFAGAHNLVSIGNCCGPVEALAECVAYEGVRRRMVAAHARVDVSNEFLAVGDGNAPLQDARHDVLVQLAVNHGE
jgi:hypothetical protein